MRIVCHTDGTPVWRLRLEAAEGAEPVVDWEALASLANALEKAESDEGCRVIVIEGATEGAFCRGIDLGYVAAHPDEDVSSGVHDFGRYLSKIRQSKKVIIAAVDGDALGGGIGLVAGADFAIATARSTFGLPEIVIGLLPAMVLPLLLERMPLQKARTLAMSSSVDAMRALELGLLDKVVDDPADLEKAVRAVIKHALRVKPAAVAHLKRFCDQVAGMDCQKAISFGADHTAELIRDRKNIETIRRFMDGEPLAWFKRYQPNGSNR
ncbi:MAG: enoyl-CoA hydratase/isomerase family protein [Pseudomonadota bacterium]